MQATHVDVTRSIRFVSIYRLISIYTLTVTFLVVGCGGGGSARYTPPPPPPPPSEDFSLDLPSSITLQQGGAPQNFSIEATLSGEVGDSTLTVSFSNLPNGVTVWPNQPTSFGVNLAMSQHYLISAALPAQPGTATVNVTGVLGSVTHSYSLQVSIANPAPFQLSLSPAQLQLSAGIPQTTQATITSNAGPPPDVSFSISTLPLRTDLDYPIVTGTEPGPFSLTFNTTIASRPLSNFPIFVTAADNSGNTSTVVLPVSLKVPFPPITTPTRSTVVRTDDIPTGVVYDRSRRLIYAALPNLNEVRVFSSTDSHLVATIITTHPVSIDESADGSKIFTGSYGQITTIDPDRLQVIQSNTIPVPSGSPTTPSAQVLTLSTGNVLVLSGAQLYLWNASTAVATPLDLQNLSITSLNRSNDRTRVLILGTPQTGFSAGVVYDAPSGTFGSIIQNITGFNVGAPNGAVNPDGSQIAVISPGYSDGAGNLYFYDGQLNPLASQPLYNIDSTGQLIYGLDGTTLYVFTSQPDVGNVGVAYDTTTMAPKGLFTMATQNGTTAVMPYAIDETGMIFGPDTGNFLPEGTLAFTDASHPGALVADQSLESSGFPAGGKCPGGASTIGGTPFPPAPSLLLPDPLCFPSNDSSLLDTSGLFGAGFDQNVKYNLFVGPPPSSPESEQATNLSVYSFSELDLLMPPNPPKNTPGPVNLTLTRPDGWYQVIPEGFSYGPTILFADATGIPSAGGTTVSIFGYQFVSPSVTIGGKPASVVSVGVPSSIANGIYPVQQLQVTAPPGSPGPAEISVTTQMGGTSFSGLQYLNSAQTYPISGTLSGIVYDQPRQRLYISNKSNNRVEIFDLAKQALLSPITVGNTPTNLGLTPDGTRLAVLNSTDGTVSVVDPVQAKTIATYPGYTTQDRANCQGSTPLGLSATTIAPHRALIAFECPFLVHVLNLDTGVISCSGIAGCDSTGTILNTGLAALNPQAAVSSMASSTDGTKAFLSSAFSEVALLDLNQNSLTPSIGVESQGANSAVNADANLFAANLAIYNSKVELVNLASGVGYFNTSSEGEFGGGEVFNPSGSLLFLISSGVDIFDVHQGRLALRVALPEQPVVSLGSSSLAIDETGSKIFILTNSGVAIVQIAVVPLSLATVTPSTGAAGVKVTLRGSGFQSGAKVMFGTASAIATFVDGMTLSAIVPSLPSGPVRVTVTNPDGTQYSFDNAFTVN